MWFTSNFIATVPDEFIPIELDPLRRRSSIFEDFVGFGSGKKGDGVVVGGGEAWGRKKSSSKVAVADAPEEEAGVMN